jgi:hypothetical protein
VKVTNSGDGLLGASVINGRTDAKLYIKRVSDDDPRRIFHATARKGLGMDRTYLEFNLETETNTLGMTVAEEKKSDKDRTSRKIKDSIYDYFIGHPDSSFDKDCLPVIEGNTEQKRRIFKQLLRTGEFTRSGKGTKSSPYTFRLREMLTEESQSTQSTMAVLEQEELVAI